MRLSKTSVCPRALLRTNNSKYHIAVGVPSSYCAPDDAQARHETIDLAPSPDGRLLASLTAVGVYVWAAGTARVLLGQRTAPLADGDLYWRVLVRLPSCRRFIATRAPLTRTFASRSGTIPLIGSLC